MGPRDVDTRVRRTEISPAMSPMHKGLKPKAPHHMPSMPTARPKVGLGNVMNTLAQNFNSSPATLTLR